MFFMKEKVFLFFKRMFDIIFSLFAILLCFVLLWWWITIINIFATKGHPFFAPDRLGKNKKIFKMFKFRSMKMNAPIIPAYELSKEDRKKLETRFGRFLRATSLDETPQFINILIGQMSIVGPRPVDKTENILIEARDSYNPSSFSVRQGLTGFAQVYMKRQHDSMSKAWFDCEYVKKMSILLDIKIIVHTFLLLFKGR